MSEPASAPESAAGNLSRRGFIGASTAAAGVLAASAAPASAADANSRLRIGFIGPGGRGFGAHVKTLAKLRSEGANIDLVAVSEVYKNQEKDKDSPANGTFVTDSELMGGS